MILMQAGNHPSGSGVELRWTCFLEGVVLRLMMLLSIDWNLGSLSLHVIFFDPTGFQRIVMHSVQGHVLYALQTSINTSTHLCNVHWYAMIYIYIYMYILIIYIYICIPIIMYIHLITLICTCKIHEQGTYLQTQHVNIWSLPTHHMRPGERSGVMAWLSRACEVVKSCGNGVPNLGQTLPF